MDIYCAALRYNRIIYLNSLSMKDSLRRLLDIYMAQLNHLRFLISYCILRDITTYKPAVPEKNSVMARIKIRTSQGLPDLEICSIVHPKRRSGEYSSYPING